MENTEIAIIGSGPAGLAAAIEARKTGAEVILIDENSSPGGQLFKQIHKFFGSKEHGAGKRGFQIGNEYLAKAEKLGVHVMLDTTVFGIFADRVLGLATDKGTSSLKANKIIIATGATENSLPFSGWTLPGVMGAGAAQTMMNIHRLLPGKKVMMVGSGNVGLIVSYQLMQAGAEVAAVVEAAPKFGGYYVHAAKLLRAGVPIYTSHTIQEARGKKWVESGVIAQVTRNFDIIEETQRELEIDTICLAVGLTPLTELAWMAGCKFKYAKNVGSFVPLQDRTMQTTVDGVYVAGDITMIEEASTAMEEGRIAGVSAAASLGYLSEAEFIELRDRFEANLRALRGETDDFNGEYYQSNSEGEELLKKSSGKFALIDCPQKIPCNPCETACPFDAIHVGSPITNLPKLNLKKCTGCGNCVAACPGLAIVVIDMTFSETEAVIKLPYEFLPLPQKDQIVDALDKFGKPVCQAKVLEVRNLKIYNLTPVLSIAVPKNYVFDVRTVKV